MSRQSKWAVALALCLTSACGKASAPSGFGVDLTIALTPAARAQVTSVKLHVSGAETYDVPALPISEFPGGTAHLRYIPGVTSGTLAFTADGLDGTANTVASGSSGSVTLIAGKAVSATIQVDLSTGTNDMAVGDMSAIDLAASDAFGGDLADGAMSPAVISIDHQPTYDFGTVLANTASGAVTFTVSNSGGSVSSTLQAATLSGSGASAYSVQTDNCSGVTLAPAASCTILVVLGPTGAPSTPTATLTVSATSGGTTSVALTGSVVTPGAITLSVMPSASPTVVLPNGTAMLTVTVKNSGGVATGGISWSFTGSASADYSVLGGTCTPNQTLAGNASCTLSVQFAPNTGGARNATLQIAASPGGPGLLQLGGIALTPAAVSFTQAVYADTTPVVAGSAGTITMTLQNTGTAPSLNLPSTVQTTAHTDFVYQAGGTCVLGAPLPGSSTCTLLVRFQPSSYGNKGDVLTLDVGGVIHASLNGIGQQTFTLTVTNSGASGADEVTSNPAGIACGGPGNTACVSSYVVTTTPPMVTLSASQTDANSRLVGFTGDCVGATNCSVSVTKNESVTATWHATFVASVTIVGGGTVTSTSTPAFNCSAGTCSLSFDTGTSVSLSETPTGSEIFSGWSGGCSGAGACTLTSASPNAAATFTCPTVGSTAHVDHTNGTDDASHGGGLGGCALKTLNYAINNTTGKTISLIAADTFPGGVTGETVSAALKANQSISCNGATFKNDSGTVGAQGLIYLSLAAGSTNNISGCIFDGGPTSNAWGITLYGSEAGTISGNTFRNLQNAISTDFSGNMTISNNSFEFSVTNGIFPSGTLLIQNNEMDTSSEDITCNGAGMVPGATGTGNYRVNPGTSVICQDCAHCPFN